MCTAISYKNADHYFGRTLDLEYHYHETVTVTPRNFAFSFRMQETILHHYAMIGMATVEDGYPLYYEAANEWGLSMAGLHFPCNAYYFPTKEGRDNIAPFELIPWVLSQCKNVREARPLLKKINLCSLSFDENYPVSPLHWILSDGEQVLTIESLKDGLHIYENPVGVLTNNPPFEYQMLHLADYMNLTPQEPESRFGNVEVPAYSRGLGAKGLPGDVSSTSRFVRAAFVKMNAGEGTTETESVGQFFHILGTVAQTRGCTVLKNGEEVVTVYTCCINADKGIYYYTTYENQCITAVSLKHCQMDGENLELFPVIKEQKILWKN